MPDTAEKPVKLTEPMEAALRYIAKRGAVTKSMIQSYGPRLGSYHALVNRGLAQKLPMSSDPFTLTDLGRAHPAVAKG